MAFAFDEDGNPGFVQTSAPRALKPRECGA